MAARFLQMGNIEMIQDDGYCGSSSKRRVDVNLINKGGGWEREGKCGRLKGGGGGRVWAGQRRGQLI